MAVVWLMAVSMNLSAEIVAWKVPLARFAIQGMESDGIARLKAPPEPSPFFGVGDELWDLKGIPKAAPDRAEGLPYVPPPRLETNPPLEWVVWNATTSTLVTKSDWNGIWQLHNRMNVLGQPKQCRVLIDVFEVPKDGDGLSENTRPVSSLSLVSRSGQMADSETRSGARTMRAKVEPTFGENLDAMDLNLEFSCWIPPQPGFDLTTRLVLKPGQPIWVARDSDGESGLDVKVAASIELIDGTPYLDVVRVQSGGQWKNVVVKRNEFRRHRTGENSWLGIFHGARERLLDFESENTNNPPVLEGKFLEVNVPEGLKPWFGDPVWNVTTLFKNAGIQFDDSADIAGYDRWSESIFLHTKSVAELDKLEMLFTGGCLLPARLMISSFDGVGETRIVSRAGSRPTLVRSAEGKEIKRVEIEATVGEAEDLIDLRYFFHDQPSEGKLQHINSSAALHAGKWLEILGGKVEESGNLRAKVEVTHLE